MVQSSVSADMLDKAILVQDCQSVLFSLSCDSQSHLGTTFVTELSEQIQVYDKQIHIKVIFDSWILEKLILSSNLEMKSKMFALNRLLLLLTALIKKNRPGYTDKLQKRAFDFRGILIICVYCLVRFGHYVNTGINRHSFSGFFLSFLCTNVHFLQLFHALLSDCFLIPERNQTNKKVPNACK